MPKTDDGFQGWRPAAFCNVWDLMNSRQRRRAFYGDLALAIAGSALLWWMFG